MKKFMILLAGIILLYSCNSGNSAEQGQDSRASVSVDEFFANPDNYAEKEITISGLVTHVCKHGGQKLFIVGNNDATSIRINTSDDIPEFGIEMEGSMVNFTGTVKVMDEEFIAIAEAEEKQHHPEREENHSEEELSNRNKEYYIIAKSFEIRDK